jgi:hypothetical protein
VSIKGIVASNSNRVSIKGIVASNSNRVSIKKVEMLKEKEK